MKFASGISLEFLQGFFGVFMGFFKCFFPKDLLWNFFGNSSSSFIYSLRISPEVSADLAPRAYERILPYVFSKIPSEVPPGILLGASLSIHPRVFSKLTLV